MSFLTLDEVMQKKITSEKATTKTLTKTKTKQFPPMPLVDGVKLKGYGKFNYVGRVLSTDSSDIISQEIYYIIYLTQLVNNLLGIKI